MATSDVVINILGNSRGVEEAVNSAEHHLAHLGEFSGIALAAVGTAAVGAGVALFHIGDQFDQAYDKIRVATGATGAQMATLQQDFRDVVSTVPTTFGAAGDAISEVAQKIHGVDVTTVTEQLLELSRITHTDLNTNIEESAHLFDQWGISGQDANAALDRLFRTTQSTGVPMATLLDQVNQFGPTFRQAGLSLNQTEALLAQFNAAGLSASDIVPALSRGIATLTRAGQEPAQALQSLFDAIKNAPSDVAAGQLALTDFGTRAGPRMAELIREGRLSYADLVTTINGGGDTILQAGQDTQHFAEKWELFKNRTLVGLEPLAIAVFEGVGRAMDIVGPYFQRFSAWFNEKLPQAIAYVTPFFDRVTAWFQQTIAAAVTYVTPYLQRFADWLQIAIPQAVDYLQPYVDRIVGWFGAHLPEALDVFVQFMQGAFEGGKRMVADLADAFGTNQETILKAIALITAGLIGLAIAWNAGPGVIVTGIVLLVAGFLYAYQNFEAFRLGVQVTFLAVKEVVTLVIDNIRERIQSIVDFVQGVVDFFAGVFTGDWGRAWNGIQEIVHGVVENIDAMFLGLPGRIVAAIGGVGTTIWNAIHTALEWMRDNWKTLIIDVILGMWIGLPLLIVGQVSGIGGTIWNGVKGGLDALKTAFLSVVTDVAGFFASLPGRIIDGLSSLGDKIWNAVKDGLQSLYDRVQSKVQAITDLFHSIVTLGGLLGGGSGTVAPVDPVAQRVTGRAAGGPVFPGYTYTVGETAPETLVMTGSGGFVIPNANPRPSGTTHNEYHFHFSGDGPGVAEEVWAKLQDLDRVA